MSPTDTVLEFVKAINAQHMEKMVGMMTPDHCFIDSEGSRIPNRRAMRDAWMGYFKIVPDYRIEVSESFAEGPVVVVVGTAGGHFSRDGSIAPQNRWQVPAAWRAVVDGNRIAEWQVFVDNQPLRRIMLACGIDM